MYKKYAIWTTFFTTAKPQVKEIQVFSVLVERDRDDAIHQMESLAETMVDVNEWDRYRIDTVDKIATLQISFDDEE